MQGGVPAPARPVLRLQPAARGAPGAVPTQPDRQAGQRRRRQRALHEHARPGGGHRRRQLVALCGDAARPAAAGRRLAQGAAGGHAQVRRPHPLRCLRCPHGCTGRGALAGGPAPVAAEPACVLALPLTARPPAGCAALQGRCRGRRVPLGTPARLCSHHLQPHRGQPGAAAAGGARQARRQRESARGGRGRGASQLGGC